MNACRTAARRGKKAVAKVTLSAALLNTKLRAAAQQGTGSGYVRVVPGCVLCYTPGERDSLLKSPSPPEKFMQTFRHLFRILFMSLPDNVAFT
jgi:hypothetical protein